MLEELVDFLSLIRDNADVLRTAAWITLRLNFWALLLAFIVGTLLGVSRHYSPRGISFIVGSVIDMLRAIPLFVTMVWFFFALPILLNDPSFDPLVAGVFALGLHSSVYIAEAIRGGLASVRPGQMRAALALGMRPRQAVVRVVFPQAFVRTIPTIGFLVANTINNSTLASVIAVPELLYQTQILDGQTGRPLELYSGLLVFYFVVIFALGRAIEVGYQRVAMRGSS
jgi:polar amino acid transport system permease protein